MLVTYAQASDKGASSWLNVLPLEEHRFSLTKGEFRDALSIRYDKPLQQLPSKCPCGNKFDLTHALNFKRGGYVIMRHNNIRDFEANLALISPIFKPSLSYQQKNPPKLLQNNLLYHL